MDSETTLEEAITRLIEAFYRRVRTDELIGPMYPADDWEGAEQRLRDFLIFRFGGSDRYLQDRGHPRLRIRHMPFKIGAAERDRWIEIMRSSMEEVELPATVVSHLDSFFTQTADFMRNKP